MNLSIILTLLKIVGAVAQWLERARWKAEGRKEYEHEASEAHDARVAEANAARDDFDAINRVPIDADPYNRDRH